MTRLDKSLQKEIEAADDITINKILDRREGNFFSKLRVHMSICSFDFILKDLSTYMKISSFLNRNTDFFSDQEKAKECEEAKEYINITNRIITIPIALQVANNGECRI